MAGAEFDLIESIRRSVRTSDRVIVGIGDDAAVLARMDAETLLATDMLLEGIHFDRKRDSIESIGRKALAVNLSDIAAMAGEPIAAVVAVGLPDDLEPEAPLRLHQGMETLAREFGVSLAGGDTNRSVSGLVLCVTIFGVTTGNRPVLRSGARPGDAICVTGKLGGSILGRHSAFTPRLREAQWLHRTVELRAMMDLSDGLGGDIFQIIRESGVGARIVAEKIPVSEAAFELAARDGRQPWEHALDDGEDFELLFAVDASVASELLQTQPLTERFGVEIHCVGEFTAGRQAELVAGGVVRTFQRRGFQHRIGGS